MWFSDFFFFKYISDLLCFTADLKNSLFVCLGMFFNLRSKKHHGPEKCTMNLPTGFTWKALNTTAMKVIKKQIKRGRMTQSEFI